MSSVLEAKDLVVRYGQKTILDKVSLTVEKGHIFGFIGHNGAGKSTFIKTLLGFLFPASGTVRLHGESPDRPGAKKKIGFLPESSSYYPFLTPVEALSFYGEVCGLEPGLIRERTRELLELVGLADVKNKRISTFSKGMAQKLSLAQALIHDPETLILDEPTTGLDPLAKTKLRDLLIDQKKKGKTIFFSSHELSEVELLCDSMAMIREGKIVAQGAMSDVLKGSGESLEKFFVKMMTGTTS